MTPTIYRWPQQYLPKRSKFFPLAGGLFSQSRYTGRTRASVTSATPWMADMIFDTAGEDIWGEIRAMILRLSGTFNQVRLFDPSRILPRGIAAGINRTTPFGTNPTKFSDNTIFSDGTSFMDGSPVAFLARDHNRGERNVLIGGLVPSQAVSISIDDHLEIGGYMHSCLSTVRSNSSGQALVPIAPALRIDIPKISALSKVNFDHPTSPFMLRTDFAGIEVQYPMISDIGVNFVEVLP